MQIEINPSPSARKIHKLATRRAERYLQSEAEMLDSVIEISVNRTYLEYGYDTITRYIQDLFKFTDNVAANFVRVANKARVIPEIKFAIDDGMFTVTQARVVAPVITPENKAEWIEKAATLTKRELEKEVAIASPKDMIREKLRPVGPDRTRVECELDDETAELLMRALTLLANRKKSSCAKAGLLKEALREFVNKHDPVLKAERSRDRSNVKHKLDVNKRDEGKCQATMPDGSKCGSERWVHQHHVHFKSHGGADVADNVVTMCSAHQRMYHEQHPH